MLFDVFDVVDGCLMSWKMMCGRMLDELCVGCCWKLMRGQGGLCVSKELKCLE